MKRYDIFAYCGCEDSDINYEHNECADGDWVRYEDANAEIERLKELHEKEIQLSVKRLESVQKLTQINIRLRDALERIAGLNDNRSAVATFAKYIAHEALGDENDLRAT